MMVFHQKGPQDGVAVNENLKVEKMILVVGGGDGDGDEWWCIFSACCFVANLMTVPFI
jgi:hypothetical protein